MSRLVGGGRSIRRRVATILGVLGALAAVFVPSAAGDPPVRLEKYTIEFALKCNGQDPSVCPQIPGFGQFPQLGQAGGQIQLFRNLDTGEKWGDGHISFHTHTVAGNPGPHAGAIVQDATYTDQPDGRPAWFIAPTPRLLGKPGFFVNGTRCDGHGFTYQGEVNCTTPPAGPLTNQATNHPATPGHYDWEALLPVIPQPEGVSISVNVNHFIEGKQVDF
jgi:hypothetical protein